MIRVSGIPALLVLLIGSEGARGSVSAAVVNGVPTVSIHLLS